ncbi:Ren-like exclusion protein [Vibrio phage pYD21-A]|uniref:Ren-like exclusion protein n=1 Tax=Vibrio phage pYD21-A TaxID=754049 RepID=UPI0002C0763C|nr:Ren-like exclusion protein [Vibrio phage pYD21-A]AGH16100.1 hypothetical protein VPKG_00063 [Vibrio phage pYD21-A]
MRKNGNSKHVLRVITDHQPVTTKKIAFLLGLTSKQVSDATQYLRDKSLVKLVRNGYVVIGGEFDNVPANNVDAVKLMLEEGKYTLQEIAYELKCSDSVVFQAVSDLRNQGCDIRKVYWLRGDHESNNAS